MTCNINFTVDDDTAEDIIASIENAIEDADESWEFSGEFQMADALDIKRQLEAQLDQ